MAEGHKIEAQMLEAGAREFADKFSKEHGLEISFDESAVRRLVERARAERMTMSDLCAHLFKDYQFGLSLIKKNTGRTQFVLDAAAIDAPDKFLSDLVVQSTTRLRQRLPTMLRPKAIWPAMQSGETLDPHEAFVDHNPHHRSRRCAGSGSVACNESHCRF